MTQYWGLIKALQNSWREGRDREQRLQEACLRIAVEKDLTPAETGELICEMRQRQKLQARAQEKAAVERTVDGVVGAFESLKWALIALAILLIGTSVLARLFIAIATGRWI